MKSKTYLQENNIKHSETADDDLKKEVDAAFDAVQSFNEGYRDGYSDGINESDYKGWWKGFLAGSGAAFTGFVIGKIILVLMDKKTK